MVNSRQTTLTFSRRRKKVLFILFFIFYFFLSNQYEHIREYTYKEKKQINIHSTKNTNNKYYRKRSRESRNVPTEPLFKVFNTNPQKFKP